MPRATQRGGAPRNRALRWEDISKEGQGELNTRMAGLGASRSGIPARRENLERQMSSGGTNQKTKVKAEQRLNALNAFEPVLRNDPITHRKATGARASLVQQNAARQVSEGTETETDWYFRHHQKMADVAADTGFSKDKVIAASAVMSPQNAPDQEAAAVSALAHGHANPRASITVSKEAATRSGDPGLGEYVGRPTHPSKFSPTQLAVLSSPAVRPHTEASGIDMEEIAKGGSHTNVAKAVDVLRGNVPAHQAIDPASSPKVWSYHSNIAQAKPGGAVHEEFISRMNSLTQVPGQTRMDLFGLKGSKEGILSPNNDTAEDSWMQAVSTRQSLKSTPVPGRTGRAAQQSPAKFSVGEGGSANDKLIKSPSQIMPGASSSQLRHAWENRATRGAAAQLSRKTGEIIPATGIQAGAWIEGRRQAGKDPAYAERSQPKSFSAKSQQSLSQPATQVSADSVRRFTPEGQQWAGRQTARRRQEGEGIKRSTGRQGKLF